MEKTSNGLATSSTEDCAPVKKFTILFENGKRLRLSSHARTSTDTISNSQVLQQDSTTAQQSNTVSISVQPENEQSKSPTHEEVTGTGAWLINSVFKELEDCLRTKNNNDRTSGDLAMDCVPKARFSARSPVIPAAVTSAKSQQSWSNSNSNSSREMNVRSRIDPENSFSIQSCLQSCLSVAQKDGTDCLAAMVHVLLRQSDDYSDLMQDEDVIRYEAKMRTKSTHPQSVTQLLDSVAAKKAILNGMEQTIGDLPVATVWKLIARELLANRRIDEAHDPEFSSSSSFDMSEETNGVATQSLAIGDTNWVSMPSGVGFGLGISATASANSDGNAASQSGARKNHELMSRIAEDPYDMDTLLTSSLSVSELKQIIDNISLRPSKLGTLKFDKIGRITPTYKRERIKEIMDQLYEDDQPISSLIVTELIRKYDHLAIDGPSVAVLMCEAGYKHTGQRYRWVKTADSRREDSANTLRSLAECTTLRFSDPVQQRFKEVVDELARTRKIVDVDAVIGELALEGIQLDEDRATGYMRKLPYMKFNSAVDGWIRLDYQLCSLTSKRIKIKRCIDQLLRSGEMFLKVSRIASLLYESGWKSLKKPSIAGYVHRVLPTLDYIEFDTFTKSWRLKPGANIPPDDDAIPSVSSATAAASPVTPASSSTSFNQSDSTPRPRLLNKLKLSHGPSVFSGLQNANSQNKRSESQPARLNTNAQSNSAAINTSQVCEILDFMYSPGNEISVNQLIDKCYELYKIKLEPSEAIRLMYNAGYEKVGPADTDWALCLNNKRYRRDNSSTLAKRLKGPVAALAAASNATVIDIDNCNERGPQNIRKRATRVRSAQSNLKLFEKVQAIVRQMQRAGEPITTNAVHSEILRCGMRVPKRRVRYQMEFLTDFYSERKNWLPVDDAYRERIARTKKRLEELRRTQKLTASLIRSEIMNGSIQSNMNVVAQLMRKCGYAFCHETCSWRPLSETERNMQPFALPLANLNHSSENNTMFSRKLPTVMQTATRRGNA